MGLDVKNTAALQAASAPEFLSQPVPDSWLMDHEAEVAEGEEEEEEEEGEAGDQEYGEAPQLAFPSRFFLTQGRPANIKL